MAASFVTSVRLRSGALAPTVGLGVYQSEPGEETYNAVLTALQLGYRHIDSAEGYRNEESVGQAVRDSGIPRKEVFVTSKIFATDKWKYQETIDRVKESNRRLGLGYIDLYLLHAPCDSASRPQAWQALEDLQAEGILKDIGVSNFGEAHLAKLAETAKVKPAVNQIELHPWLTRTALVNYCEEQGIHLQAYSPLARAERMWDPVLKEIAKEANATPAQVLVAWGLAKGFTTLPKSVKAARIKENLEGAKVKLTDAQIAKLDALDQYLVTGWDPIKNHAV